jgi:excisionase family DNA binding protein
MPRLKNPPQPRQRLAPLLYSVDEYCDLTATSRPKAYNDMRSGSLPYVTVGGRRKIPVSVIEELCKVHT